MFEICLSVLLCTCFFFNLLFIILIFERKTALLKGVNGAGPCCLTSIRRGDIYQRHDCALLFYDINADVIHWTQRSNGEWRLTIEKNRCMQAVADSKGGAVGRHPPPTIGSDFLFNNRLLSVLKVRCVHLR